MGDMLQQKIDKIFQELPNVFGIAYDILIIGFGENSREHEGTLRWVMEICQ